LSRLAYRSQRHSLNDEQRTLGPVYRWRQFQHATYGDRIVASQPIIRDVNQWLVSLGDKSIALRSDNRFRIHVSREWPGSMSHPDGSKCSNHPAHPISEFHGNYLIVESLVEMEPSG
jgi:hypothetical protein